MNSDTQLVKDVIDYLQNHVVLYPLSSVMYRFKLPENKVEEILAIINELKD